MQSNQSIKRSIAFRCDPLLFKRLLKEADEKGDTLSAFIETALFKREEEAKRITDLEEQLKLIHEHPLVKTFFEVQKGKPFNYKDCEGNERSQQINSELDVLIVMLNSFIIKRP